VNIDFYAIESIKQNQAREHQNAEKRARIHEAWLAAPRQSSRFARMIAAMRRQPNPRLANAEPVAPTISSVAISTNALNGD
jgi:hypothetical protein